MRQPSRAAASCLLIATEEHKLSVNPFTEELDALKAEHDQAQSELQKWQDQLIWHRGFNLDQANLDLRNAVADVEAANAQLQQSRERGSALVATHAAQEAKTRMGMDPRYWFSAERDCAKRQVEESINLLALQSAEVQKFEIEAMAAAHHVRNCREVLSLAREFDPLLAQAASLALLETVERVGPQVDVLQKRSDELDERLKDLMQMVGTEMAEASRLRARMNRANEYEKRIASRPRGGNDRRLIHEQCESELGNRSPEEVLRKCEGALERVGRTLEKLHAQIDEIVRFSSNDIRHIVIDGSNLCYANGGDFIGLNALEALVPILEKKHKVTVFFDASIRHNTGLSSAQIAARFSEEVEVHIVAAGSKADDTIVARVEADPHAFVLTGDAYGEFSSRMAAKHKRKITHETTRGFTYVRAMQISVTYDVASR